MKAQITVEYIILFGLMVITLIPAGYYVMRMSSDVNEEYEMNQLDSYVKSITKQSKIIYYNGLYSKMTLTPNFNTKTYDLHEVYTLEIRDPGLTEDNYLLVITVNTSVEDGLIQKNLTYWSEVPLMTEDCIGGNSGDCGGAYTMCRRCDYDPQKFYERPIRMEAIFNGTEIKIELSDGYE